MNYRRSITWLLISLLCFAAALYFWRLGDRWEAERKSKGPSRTGDESPKSKVSEAKTMSSTSTLVPRPSPLDAVPDPRLSTPSKAKNDFLKYRLSNTTLTSGQLTKRPHSIILENALYDTEKSIRNPKSEIPPHLVSNGDPGAYIVQSRTDPDNAFRSKISAAGAVIISYIPNNAYLVRASAGAAQQLGADPQVQQVLAYEPYYKLKGPLLKTAAENLPLPDGTMLNVVLFADRAEATTAQIQALGGQILSQDQSPFGPVLKLRPMDGTLSTLAGLTGVKGIESTSFRQPANDLSRVAMGIAINSSNAPNYLGLTGTNVIVAIADSGVDTNHPDLAGRIVLDANDVLGAGGYDPTGHGTHEAGIIMGNGIKSTTVTNFVQGSFSPAVTNQFHGKAPGATLLSLSHSLAVSNTTSETTTFGGFLNQKTILAPSVPDFYLQQTAARYKAAISQNGWNYDAPAYDISAASYDAAVRDSLPFQSGSQPVLYVFAAGNDGGAADDGTAGFADSILSPATAKNVITVGAVEQFRNITNQFYICTPDSAATNGVLCQTNQPWMIQTDSGDQIAGFSARGNVGVSIEGDKGRFKPDVVAPGAFVISTRSTVWDQISYYSPTGHIFGGFAGVTVSSNSPFVSFLNIPPDAIQLTITLVPTTNSPNPFPPTPIFVKQSGPPTPSSYTYLGTNQVTVAPISPTGVTWWYGVFDATNVPVSFDIVTDITVTNNLGNYQEVLSNLNNTVGPWYRFESGSSMAAAAVSGTLALMQEFYQQRFNLTNSPALMKALLINGAVSLGALYDYQVNTPLNSEGWGMVTLTNSAPLALPKPYKLTATPVLFFDQSPSNALATAQSQTYFIQVDDAAQSGPMRITLAWTDPPGDPSAGVKLVNDLDLVVTNLDTGDIYFGNDILSGATSNLPWDTNSIPNIDRINNVENVFIDPLLWTNYSVTVFGRHVNVNAVTAHPDNVVQDYALVISAGEGVITNALTLASTGPIIGLNSPQVTVMTNSFEGNPDFSGGVLLGQHVGANTPLLGTNTISLLGANPSPWPNTDRGQITIGITNQWHFYVLTNDQGFTNAAFLTTDATDLSVPRMGVTNVDDPANAVRPSADIELYVSTDPNLTNLAPNVVFNAYKSLTRPGEETIILSNAVRGVYYAGVKSEDQMAAEYVFAGVFSRLPFGATDANGNETLVGFPTPQFIPDAFINSAGHIVSGQATIYAIAPAPIFVRRVIVTNVLTHELVGDLIGVLSHGSLGADLNNHTTNTAVFNKVYIYDDSAEKNVPGAVPTDGPRSLKNFAGKQGSGQWHLTEYDGTPGNVGTNGPLRIFLERQPDLTTGINATIHPGACREDFVQIPPQATNLTISVTVFAGTGPLSVQVCPLGDSGANCQSTLITNMTAGAITSLSISLLDTPPLQPGQTYSVTICNLGPDDVNIFIKARIDLNTATIFNSLADVGSPVNIQDDAVTYAYVTNFSHMLISSLDVALSLKDPRVSDLAITLISPTGTRVLLFEDRGGVGAVGLGTFTNINSPFLAQTNWSPFYTCGFEASPVGPYVPGAVFEGWHVVSNSVNIYPELPAPWISNNVCMLQYGAITNSLPTTNSSIYSLSFNVTHAPYLVGMVGWWPFDGAIADRVSQDIFGGHDGLLSGDVSFVLTGKVSRAYYGDGVATRMVVPACPDIDVANPHGLNQAVLVGPVPWPGGFSIEGWINPANITNPAPLVEWYDTTTNYLFAQGVQFWLGSPPTDSGPLLPTNGPGSLTFVLQGEGQPPILVTTNFALTNGGWQHVALTYDNSSFLAKIYVNGQPVAAQVIDDDTAVSTTGNLYFGYHPAGPAAGASYQGGLDEFGLFARALSDCELAAIFSADSRGKYGTNVLWCPLTNSPSGASLTVQLTTTAPLLQSTFTFTNGLIFTNGPQWDTDIINFNNSLLTTNGVGTNLAGVAVYRGDPNTTVDNFVLSALLTNYISGLMRFTENTNLAVLPIKFALPPYAVSNFPPVLIFSNDFELATQRVYKVGQKIPGMFAGRDWTVINSSVTVMSNAPLDLSGTNWVALANGGLETTLPTSPGHRYQLTYSLRGPCAVGWWSGDTEPLSHRAWDLIGGNNGAFIFNCNSSSNSFVGRTSLYFDGAIEPVVDPDIGGDFDDAGGKIELGDPDNLRLTNSFTIEGWIRHIPQNDYIGTEQILFRGDFRDCLDPYYLAIEPSLATTASYDLHFHIESNTNGFCGVDLITTNAPILYGQWQHIAAVFEANVLDPSTGLRTNQLRLYVNSVEVMSNYTYQVPFRDLDPHYSPGITIGNRSRYLNNQPFRGYLDELSVYARALTDPEIVGIYNNGPSGKADFAVPPAKSLAKLTISLDNTLMDTAYGDNASWTTRTISFDANSTNALLDIQSLLPGTIVDGISLTEVPQELNYLPEESLSVLSGQDAFGVWALEIWDTRTGTALTNDIGQLLQWQLDFTLVPSNPAPVISLQPCIAYTNSIPAFGVQDFVVPVPQWAIWATNTILSADRFRTTNAASIGLWFNTNGFPVFGTNDISLLFTNNTASTNLTTDTLVSPWITPGQSYYLAVTNPNPYSVTFAVDVCFDITTLTNCQMITNSVTSGGIPRYFQFDVPTNNVPGSPPENVNIWLSGLLLTNGLTNVTVVASSHLPLPDLGHYDYISQRPCTNDQIVMVVTQPPLTNGGDVILGPNTTPFPIQTNRWYIGVFSSAPTNISFTIQACYTTNYPTLIDLTNRVPYFGDFLSNSNFLAPPGPPRSFFFQFTISNSPESVLFELYNLSGDADLVLQRDVPPTMPPYFDGSFRTQRQPQQIVVRRGSELGDIRGNWFLGIINNESTNVSYAIRATTARTNGLLVSALPIVIDIARMPSAPGNLLLSWNSVQGETYVVEYTDTLVLAPQTNSWTPLVAVRATTPLSTWEVPILQIPSRFFRISQVATTFGLVPPLHIRLVEPPIPPKQVRLSWTDTIPGLILQWSLSPVGPWANLNLPVVDETAVGEFAVYDNITAAPKYYRLIP